MRHRKLLTYNIHANGLKSLLYPFGLSAGRYTEYASAIGFLQGEVGRTLDLGCGHSLMPSLLARQAVEVIAVDITKEALPWQKQKAKPYFLEALRASGLQLPFKNESFSAAVSISVLEHIDDESQVVKELLRVVKPNGVLVLSVPVSPHNGFTTDALFGVPKWQQNFLGSNAIQSIMKKLNVDRGNSYFERFYSKEKLLQRIIEPSGCCLEEYIICWDWKGTKILYKAIPKGVLTPLEFILAGIASRTSSKPSHLGSIILKLRKTNIMNHRDHAEQMMVTF